MRSTYFERAIFLAWFCAKPDCKFCFMSTLKGKLPDPRKARRRKESILAEAIITQLCGWKIEFISTGISSHSRKELIEILQGINRITGSKQWLNIGTLSRSRLEELRPYIKGVTGTVECINPDVRAFVCPSKPLEPVIEMFRDCEDLGLEKSMTVIIGLGEKEEDIPLLVEFIRKHKVDRVIFYALNPHEGTIFKEGPKTDYYARWIKGVRKEFSSLNIVAGSWADRLDEIPTLLLAGADAITKFPAIKLFGSSYAQQIEEGAREAGFCFEGTMTKMPSIDVDQVVEGYGFEKDLSEKINKKLKMYLKRMSRHSDRIDMDKSLVDG